MVLEYHGTYLEVPVRTRVRIDTCIAYHDQGTRVVLEYHGSTTIPGTMVRVPTWYNMVHVLEYHGTRQYRIDRHDSMGPLQKFTTAAAVSHAINSPIFL